MKFIIIVFLLIVNFCSKEQIDNNKEYLESRIDLMLENLYIKKDYTALLKQIDRENYSEGHGEVFPDKEKPQTIRHIILFDREGKYKDLGIKYLNILKKIIVENKNELNEKDCELVKHIFFNCYFRWLIYNIHYREWLLDNILYFWNDKNLHNKYYWYGEPISVLSRLYLSALLNKDFKDLYINQNEAKRLIKENYNNIIEKEILILYVSEELFDEKNLDFKENKYEGEPPYYGNFMYLWDGPFLVLNRSKNCNYYQLYYDFPNINYFIEQWAYFCEDMEKNLSCQEHDWPKVIFDWRTPLKNKKPYKFKLIKWG